MLKALDAPYQAGSRGSYWLKLKREYRNELGDSLDLVIIGAFLEKVGELENMEHFCLLHIMMKKILFQAFVKLEQVSLTKI